MSKKQTIEKIALKPNTETKEYYTSWRHGETKIVITKYHSGSIQIFQTYYGSDGETVIGEDVVFLPHWILNSNSQSSIIQFLFEIQGVNKIE